MRTRILLADDHTLVREGLRSLLARDPDIETVGEASSGREVVALAEQLEPDVVVMDVSMPGLNGIEATQRIRAAVPGARVVGLSMHADKRLIDGMLRAGATGYLLKDTAYTDLTRAIRAVAAGETYFCATVRNIIAQAYVHQTAESESPLDALSSREREVLQLIAEGHTTRVIADTLSVSVKTIESHRHQLMAKLDLRSVAELTRFAIREGVIAP